MWIKSLLLAAAALCAFLAAVLVAAGPEQGLIAVRGPISILRAAPLRVRPVVEKDTPLADGATQAHSVH